MDKKLFPPEIIEFSTEKMIHDYSQKSSVIYNAVIISIIVCFIAMFFIKIDISVGAAGALRPEQERVVISAPMDGKIIKRLIMENQNIKQGDTILIMENTQYRVQIQNLADRKAELNSLLADLQLLTNPEKSHYKLKTPYYKHAYSSFLSDILERENNLNLLQKRYLRDKTLFNKGIMPEAEFELVENEYNMATLNLKLFRNKQMDQWQYDILTYNNELRNVTAQWQQLQNQSERLILTSPCHGNVQQVSGLQDNMFVLTSQVIAEISPNSSLVAECYVSPKDIGFIQTGMAVRFRMQTYNYNEWGMIEGVVTDISKDIFLKQTGDYQEAFFKVKCKPNTLSLYLKNGYTAQLQKGLTFEARFLVTQRTLFQLLYDKVDNWLNPSNNKITKE